MSKSWRLDAATGDILRDADNQPVIDDTPFTDLVLAIGIQIDTSPGDPDLGSTIPALVAGDPLQDPAAAFVSSAMVALERLIDAGTIDRNPTITFVDNCLAIVSRGRTFEIGL
jgi:hypothetical protein